MRDPASFRDPAGCVYWRGGVLRRQVNESFAEEWTAFLSSGLHDALIADGLLVSDEADVLSEALSPGAYRVIRPRMVDFLTYPYEWSFSQLKDAALVTLAAQERALAVGMTLRDASAYNVQFIESRPILIDSLSFERSVPGRPWDAYRQFCQHFLAPLALMGYRDPRCGLLARDFIDGIPLDLAARLLPARTRLRVGLGAHVHAHARASRAGRAQEAGASGRAHVSADGQRALVDSLRRTVEGLRWEPRGTAWAEYSGEESYSTEAARDKGRLVRAMLSRAMDGRVWDLGANAGSYSVLAAEPGRSVVAIDADPAAVERLYLAVRGGRVPRVTPLLSDLTNPSPAIGWCLNERRSLIERGPAPLVLALAIIHHLAIGNNVPLPDLARFFATIAVEAILEFVPKEDPQVRRLLAGRRDVFPDYSLDGLGVAFRGLFDIIGSTPIADSERTLVHLRRREP